MITDNTLILFTRLYPIIGILMYLLLSSLKVYQIRYLQKVNSETISAEDYPGILSDKSQTADNFLKYLITYLFKYKADEWKVDDKIEGNKRIKRNVTILDGFITFLKPYLVVSFIWYFLQAWAENKLFYNELTITLGEIQVLLTWIQNHFYIKTLNSNRYLIFVLLAIICMLIPWLYDKDVKVKKVKKHFTNSLVYLSILGSISFFGAKTGNFVAEKSDKLKKLAFEIEAIHDNIYVNVAKAVLISDFQESIEKNNAFINAKVQKINELKNDLTSSVPETINNHLFQIESNILDNLIIQIKAQSDAAVHSQYGIILKPLTTTKTDNISKNRHESISLLLEKTQSNESQITYLKNEENWNVDRGNKMNNSIKEFINSESYQRNWEKVIEALFDYLLDNGLSGFLKSNTINMPEYKSIKKAIALLLTENYRSHFTKKVTKVLIEASNKLYEKAHITLNESSPINTLLDKTDIQYLENLEHLAIAEIKVARQKEQAEARAQRLLEAEAQREAQIATEKMNALRSKSTWEKMRMAFLADLKSGDFPNLKGDNRSMFLKAFEEWDNYIKDINYETLKNSDIEKIFKEYSKKHPDLMAAWGYLVIGNYYNEIRFAFPKVKAIKPIHGIVYYASKAHDTKGLLGLDVGAIFGSTGVEIKTGNTNSYHLPEIVDAYIMDQLLNIYTTEVNEYVGKFCPVK
ncbi:hypothetical protein [Emticicia sp. BO119]|uniref:hypothetical protein n=1 Tax=Emticicia sp. BO119 TaxID=2757768 RepID=UPI0015F07D95|nr:hypothetical protein [Emticicia sp. BO119]MBA4851322.1 hypothetical protein [Emticicia sp. BO119]